MRGRWGSSIGTFPGASTSSCITLCRLVWSSWCSISSTPSTSTRLQEEKTILYSLIYQRYIWYRYKNSDNERFAKLQKKECFLILENKQKETHHIFTYCHINRWFQVCLLFYIIMIQNPKIVLILKLQNSKNTIFEDIMEHWLCQISSLFKYPPNKSKEHIYIYLLRDTDKVHIGVLAAHFFS